MQLKNNHKGMTLIELLVTVAVLAILAIVVGFSVNKINGNEAKKVAEEINSMLSMARVASMSGQYAIRDTTNGKKKYELSGIQITYDKINGKAEYFEVDKNGNKHVKKTVSLGKVEGAEGNEEYYFNPMTGAFSVDPGKLKNIEIKGYGQDYMIKVVEETGHHEVIRT